MPLNNRNWQNSIGVFNDDANLLLAKRRVMESDCENWSAFGDVGGALRAGRSVTISDERISVCWRSSKISTIASVAERRRRRRACVMRSFKEFRGGIHRHLAVNRRRQSTATAVTSRWPSARRLPPTISTLWLIHVSGRLTLTLSLTYCMSMSSNVRDIATFSLT